MSADVTTRWWVGILVLAAAVLLWDLGAGSLQSWDEAIYAQIAKEVVATGDWFPLHYQQQPWFEKPPLYMWVTAAFFRILGVSEFWARAGSALAGIGLVAITFRIATLVYGRAVAVIASLILLTGAHFVFQARFGTIDVALAFLMYASFYAYLRVIDGAPSSWRLFWLLAGLAVMAKGMAAGVLIIAVLGSLALRGYLCATLRSKPFLTGLALAAVVVVPWHAAMIVGYGEAFTSQYFLRHVFARATSTLEDHAGDGLYYVRIVRDFFFPWGWLAPFALVAAGARMWRPGTVARSRAAREGEQALLLFGLAVFALYTLVRTKLAWYIVPVYPALAVLTAAMIVDAFQRKRFVLPTLAMIAVAALAAHRYSWQLAALVATVGSVLLAASAAIEQRTVRVALQAALCGALILVAAAEVVPLYAVHESPVAVLARSPDVRRGTGPLLVFAEAPAALFYSDRAVEEFYAIDELPRLLADGQAREIFIPSYLLDGLKADYDFVEIRTVEPLAYGTIRRIASR